jgi:FkbM family methyltransferase
MILSNLIKRIKFIENKFFQYTNYNALNNFFRNNIDLKKKIKIVYDLGAHKGDWSKKTKEVLLDSEFYLFEANKVHEEILNKTKMKYFTYLLSDKKKFVNFYSINSTGDSYYKQKSLYKKKDIIKIKAFDLDSLRKKLNLPFPDFIKLDTQGSELDILRGASQTLKKVVLILIEVPLIDFNYKSPKIQKYLDYMNKINFEPVELIEKHIYKKKLVQIDILFKKSV